jgi:Tfp pilus assembly protein PilN
VRQALNLARRPFRNETLPNLGVLAAVLVLAAVSVQHAFVVRDLLVGTQSQRLSEVTGFEAELARLRKQARDLGSARVAAGQIAEWAAVKGIVDRRVFSWSRLLEHLGTLLPAGVRVVAIAPRTEGRRVRVELSVVTRSRAEGFELATLLRDEGGFEGVYPISVSRVEDGERFVYTFWYEPGRETAPAEAAAGGRS